MTDCQWCTHIAVVGGWCDEHSQAEKDAAEARRRNAMTEPTEFTVIGGWASPRTPPRECPDCARERRVALDSRNRITAERDVAVAAIARVRALCDSEEDPHTQVRVLPLGTVSIRKVRAALDGEETP